MRVLSKEPGDKLIVVEGIYSMMGDVAPLKEFVEVKKEAGAYLLVDEAHSMGVLGATGNYCVARALGYAPANVVSPFQYFQLLGSVAVGWIVFGDLPDALTWAGAAVIVLSGLYIGWSQTRPGARAR